MNKSDFSRKVYITYKSRINAAERLKNTEKFIQGINIYYSIFMTVLAIYSVINNSNRLSLMITIFSVIITITIVYLASQKYGERAKSLKNNYIALSRLYACIQCKTEEELEKYNDEYRDLLDASENHSEYDYYKAMLTIKDKSTDEQQIKGEPCKHNLVIAKKALFRFMYWGSILIKVMLIILPFLLKYLAMLLEWIIQL